MNGFVMKAHELFRLQGNQRVCAPLGITEFDFIHSGRPTLDHGPNLAPDQAVFREVLQKGDNGMKINLRHALPLPTVHNKSSASASLRRRERSRRCGLVLFGHPTGTRNRWYSDAGKESPGKATLHHSG